MKLFECIVDDGEHLFRSFSAAKSKKNLMEIYGGNGKFEKVTDVTNEYLNERSIEELDQVLFRAGWGVAERSIITALVEEHIFSRK